jgi:hypothetical protein
MRMGAGFLSARAPIAHTSVNSVRGCMVSQPAPTPDDPPSDAPDATAPRQPGPCEAATRAELEALPAAAAYAAEIEALCALASLLDDRRFGSSWAAAARVLQAGIQHVRAAQAPPGGKLYSVALKSQRKRKPTSPT